MDIPGIAASLIGARELAEEAWDLASQAKEKYQEAREAIAAVGGTEPPAELAQAATMLSEAYEQTEQGQALGMTAQDAVTEYVSRLMGG